MAVQPQTPYQEFIANGTTAGFNLGFDCDDQDHLIVLVDDVEPVVGSWSLTGGAVVFGAAPTSGKKIIILRNTPFRRDGDFQSYDNSFRPGPVNKGLDKAWWKIQELGVSDWLLGRKIQKFRDDVNLTALEETLEQAQEIRDNTADSVIEVQSNVEQSQTLLVGTTSKANEAEASATAATAANTAAQQALVQAKAAEDNVYAALSTQTATVNTALVGFTNGASKWYATLALAEADIANITIKDKVDIGESANGGTWYKATAGATILTKSPYDALTQAKADATTKANAAEVNAKSYTDSIATDISAASFTADGYISATGSFLPGASFKSTDFIKVVPSQSYRIYSQVAGLARHAWYDKNQVFISAFGDDQTTLTEKTYTAPANAAYLRVSAYLAAAWNVAYIKSKAYSIDVIQKIIQQHLPQVDASKIDYSSSNVKATLDTVISKQNTIITNQNGIVGQLDLLSDKESPYFVNTAQFVKAALTPTNFGVVNVTARVSDTQMTVSDPTAFIYGGSCVVYDPTANSYTSHNVIGINGTTITVMPPLPANPTQAQTMHEANQGQHLTLFGYKGLADFAVNSIQKYSYKKSENRIFNFNPTKFERQANAQGQITTDGTTIAIPVTYAGTAKTGGFTPGTTNLIKVCDMNSGNLNIGNNAHTQYLTRSYQLQDGTAGNGFEINFSAQNSDGFIEIPLAVRDESYTSSADSQTYKTSGKARLQVFNGTTSIHDAVYAVGQVHHVFVDFAAAETIKVRVTCETSTPTSVLLSGIFAYKKSVNTPKTPFFKDGDVVAFLGDSWTQYPIASTIGETGQTRPDGSVSTGSQWLSRRMKEKLLAQGKNVTMLNMGFGGQTSRWGKYWVNKILTLNPKPTHCVICFYINDANSIGAPSNNFYDFDPVNMFVNKPASEGGINGKIPNYDEWESNIKWLCDKLVANGIKPIVIMPSQTASEAQAQAIRSGELDRLADGFN